MITVVVQGGLGNQLFQYAYGRVLTELGKEVVYDISFFDTNTEYTKREYLLNKFLFGQTIPTTKDHSNESLFTRILNKLDIDRRVRYIPINQQADNYVASGYFTTEKYFLSLREILLKEIVLTEKSEAYKEWEQKILHANKPLIIHARRTDYVGSGFVNLGEEYYTKALQSFDQDCDIFAFSDDIVWLEKTLKRQVTSVSGNGLKDYEEMMLMSLGQNFIIANSTFSWWGAWLSQREHKKVVAPKKWFKSPLWYRADRDTVPESWIRV
jgi:hypothetical protein